MRRWKKWTLMFLVVGLLVFVAPIVFTYLRPHGLRGVYGGGGEVICMCGHKLFTYIDETGYYEFVPGHRAKELLYTLQPQQTGEWIALRNGTNAFRLRLTDGKVYRTIGGNTNWFLEGLPF